MLRIVSIIVALLALGGVAYITSVSQSTSPEVPDTARLDTPVALSPDRLRAELDMALTSGGISGARFASIQQEIDALAAEGVDVGELRGLLQNLSVGGSEAPAQKTAEDRK